MGPAYYDDGGPCHCENCDFRFTPVGQSPANCPRCGAPAIDGGGEPSVRYELSAGHMMGADGFGDHGDSEFADREPNHYSGLVAGCDRMAAALYACDPHRYRPSDDIDPGKARQILRDGEANGRPLTDAQRGMFGAAAGRE